LGESDKSSNGKTKEERKKIKATKNRAEELLKRFELGDHKTDSDKLISKVKKSSAIPKMIRFGRQNLPAGPAIHDSHDIILVEGRADVLNLLKMGIDNTVALQGTNIPQSVVQLCRNRTVTALLDGDRGGDAILKELLLRATIEFVARAPVGKEIEHLEMSDVMAALDNKKSVLQSEFVNEKISVTTFLKKNHRIKHYKK
jgi:DNA primase